MSDEIWEPCVKRQVIERHDKDGTKSTIMRCAHQACSHFTKDLCPEDCAACPLRQFSKHKPPGYYEMQINERDFGQPKVLADGTIVYPKTGWEPPVLPEGYRRKNDDLRSDDAWVFIPVWPECRARDYANTVRPCGCISVNAMCAAADSENVGKPVTVDICHACPVRKYSESEVYTLQLLQPHHNTHHAA